MLVFTKILATKTLRKELAGTSLEEIKKKILLREPASKEIEGPVLLTYEGVSGSSQELQMLNVTQP